MPRFIRTFPAPQVPKRRGRDYSRFRPFVREDFEHCCAYCLRHEDWGGGEDHYALDHFCPKDPELFPHMEDDYCNLYYSCIACNGKTSKSNHWPTDEEIIQGIEFVDLCKDDFHRHYQVRSDGVIEGLTEAGCYTIDMIRLNRDALVKLRFWLLQEGRLIDKPRNTHKTGETGFGA